MKLLITKNLKIFNNFLLEKLSQEELAIVINSHFDNEKLLGLIQENNIKIDYDCFKLLSKQSVMSLLNFGIKFYALSWFLSKFEATDEEIVLLYFEKELLNETLVKYDFFSCLHFLIYKKFSQKIILKTIERASFFKNGDINLYESELSTIRYLVNTNILSSLNSLADLKYYFFYWEQISFKNNLIFNTFDWFYFLYSLSRNNGLQIEMFNNINFINELSAHIKKQSDCSISKFWTTLLQLFDNFLYNENYFNLFIYFIKKDKELSFELKLAINNSKAFNYQIKHKNIIVTNATLYKNQIIGQYRIPNGTSKILSDLMHLGVEGYITENTYLNKPLKKFLYEHIENKYLLYFIYIIDIFKLLNIPADKTFNHISSLIISQYFLMKKLTIPHQLINILNESCSDTKKITIFNQLLNSDCLMLNFEEMLFSLNIKGLALLKIIKKYKNFNTLFEKIKELHQSLYLRQYESFLLNQEKIKNIQLFENVFIPQNKADLIKIGLDMSNCLSSYYERILLKRSYVFLITFDNEKVLVELDMNLNVKQMKLSLNREVPFNIKSNILGLIEGMNTSS
jgi:hypothetical protein